MTALNIFLGLAIFGIAVYAGFWAAVKSKILFRTISKLTRYGAYLLQIDVGMLVGLLVGIYLTFLRRHYGLVPDAAETDFPGRIFGYRLENIAALLLAWHLALGLIVEYFNKGRPHH